MCLTIASEYLDRLRFGAGDRISARRSTAGVHWLATCFAVLVAGLAAAPRVQGQDALETRLLIAAAEIERAHELDELLAEHRLEIKPIVLQLLEEGIGRELDGDGEGASESYRIAARIAGAFERQFGEQSLIEAVSYVDKWTLDQKRAKLHADGLLAKGRELRSGEEAFAAYSQALELYRSNSVRLGEAEDLGGIAVVYWYAGEPDSTLDYLERALAAREAVDDRKLIGNSFSDIGSALYAFYSDYQGALDYLRRAASIRQAIGDLEPLARNYALIGRTHDELGNLDSARTYLESAVTLFRQLGRTE